MRTLVAALVAGYLALAPVYWLPGVDADLLEGAKIAMFLTALALAAWMALVEGKAALPSGLLGPAGLSLLLLASLAGLLQAEPAAAAAALKDYALTFLGLWAFYLFVRLEIDVERVLLLAAAAMAALCLLVAASAWIDALDFAGPRRFDAEHLWESGFGSVRTGWSNGAALYVVPLLFPFARRAPEGRWRKALCVAGIASIALSQLVVAGRAGLAASVAILGVAFSRPGYRRFLLIAAAAGALVLFGNLESFKRQMRITAENDAAYSLDEVASGRVELTLAGVDMALEHPVFGNGVDRAWVGEHEIHNLWIRLAAESGPFLPGVLLLVVLRVLATVGAAARRQNGLDYTPLREQAYLGGVVGGLVISMLEPRMLLGAFQVTALWWAFAGVAAARSLSGPVRLPAAPRAPLVSD